MAWWLNRGLPMWKSVVDSLKGIISDSLVAMKFVFEIDVLHEVLLCKLPRINF